ncbi:MAG: hypothetical protein E6L04_08255 [Thaumarchaeota archaeon]|nr:MAG: hypothetical protein E6L04_08255 [Nitrososphaerota archaeon]
MFLENGKCLWHMTTLAVKEKAGECFSKATRNICSMRDLMSLDLCETHYIRVLAWFDRED